jgi:purine-nucleoside phosphorylase
VATPENSLDTTSFDTAYQAALTAAAAIQQHAPAPPRVALILGSGLGGLAQQIRNPVVVPYAEIPGMPQSTVAGHAGQFVLGTVAGVSVAAMQGRFHLYEGYSPQQVVFPIRVLRLLRAEFLIVTAAAGGLAPELAAGSLLLLRDHIGLPMLAGMNPLRGSNDERFGPRFPSLTDAYDAELRALIKDVATRQGVPLPEGVYAMVAGPSYETLAELQMLRLLGADAVGMSVVPEVIAARHLGMRVLGTCLITNAALKDSTQGVGPQHAEVLAMAEQSGAQLGTLLEGVLTRLP